MTQIPLYVAILLLIGTIFYSFKMWLFIPRIFKKVFNFFRKNNGCETSKLTETKKKLFYENLKLLALISNMELYLIENKNSSLDKSKVNSNAVFLETKLVTRKLRLEHLKKTETLYEAKRMAQLNILNSVNDLKINMSV